MESRTNKKGHTESEEYKRFEELARKLVSVPKKVTKDREKKVEKKSEIKT